MFRNYVSIDVFDTCLVRRCGMPEKIWDLMCERLFEKNDFRGKLSFVNSRENAEKLASIEYRYPNINEIYDFFDVSQWGFEKEQVANLEMEIEETELFPNPYMLERISKLREKGCKIFFVSDMYLPSFFIKRILIKYGFCLENELVLVSAECRAAKYNGKIFEYLLKETHTKSRQWLHLGDNLISDVLIPKIKGIKSCVVKDAFFSDEEKKWLNDAKFYLHKHEIELWAGLSRLTRLQMPLYEDAALAVNFISSIYIPYVYFVLREAQKRKIGRLYFLSRDGLIFLQIAKNIQQGFENVECKYLKVSRKSLYPCILYEVNDYEMSLILTRDKTVAQNLECIGIPYCELSQETRKCFAQHVMLNSDSKITAFKNMLQKNDVELMKTYSVKKRKVFLDYLKQEDFFSSKCALVDLGWIGTGRCAVNYILKKEGFHSVPMFYWGVNQKLKYGMLDDELIVFNHNFDFEKKYSCADMILEHYASMNNEATVEGYQEKEGKIEPKQGVNDNCNYSMVLLNKEAVENFVKNMNGFNSLNGVSSEALYDIFLCCGLKQMERIINLPDSTTISVLKKVKIEDFGKTKSLGSFLSVKDILSLFVWGVPVSTCWVSLSVKKTFGIFAPLIRFAYMKTSQSILSKYLISWWERKKAR